jgi:hypothetical protein
MGPGIRCDREEAQIAIHPVVRGADRGYAVGGASSLDETGPRATLVAPTVATKLFTDIRMAASPARTVWVRGRVLERL